ncbi:MAG: flagellar motor switch protein FliN [Planctomycetaceae bacterium]|jgi:flagellar motor switch protein FliN/FliY|nr:flagellar motor switch protein FliN [Planctomycetaceae bacterium]
MSDDGVLDQNDIERLFNSSGNSGAGGTPPPPEPAPADGTISQNDLDALFGNSAANQPAPNSTPTPADGTISQSDLDAILNGVAGGGQSATHSQNTPPSASGPLDQSDLDALFQNAESGAGKDAQPVPGPIDQAALDVLFGGSATKPSAAPAAPTFVPSTPFDPTKPSNPATLGNGYGKGLGGGAEPIGGGFSSPMPDVSDGDEDGLPHGDLNYLLERAEKSIQSIASERLIPTEVIEFQFPEFGGTVPSAEHATLDQISEVELNVKIELGRTDMYLEDVLKLRKGSVVPLDKTAGDPVDIYVNGRLLARGEVLVMNENFCVRVAELLAGAIPME